MNLAFSEHLRHWLMVAPSVLVACVGIAVWARTTGEFSWTAALIVSGGWLTLTLTGGFLLLASAAEVARARTLQVGEKTEIGQLQAHIAEVSSPQERFGAHMAHELKTPLAVALVQMDTLVRCIDDPAAVMVHATSIAADLRHLSDRVDSFLRLARPFSPADTSHHRAVDVHDFVVEASRRSQPLAHEGAVRLVLTLAENTNGFAPLEVLGDAVLLEAMLENLLRNSLRHAPRDTRVEVTVRPRGETIVLGVRDHGAEIAVDHLASAFEWSSRESGQSPRSAGTGFGLAISKRIAEHHGGRVSLSNAPTGGCLFEVTLPRWRAEDPRPPDETPHPTGPPSSARGRPAAAPLPSELEEPTEQI